MMCRSKINRGIGDLTVASSSVDLDRGSDSGARGNRRLGGHRIARAVKPQENALQPIQFEIRRQGRQSVHSKTKRIQGYD
jgi:hypothetical protein